MRDAILSKLFQKGIAAGPNKFRANNEVLLMDFLKSFDLNYFRNPTPAEIAGELASLLQWLFGQSARIVVEATEDKFMSEDNPRILAQVQAMQRVARAAAGSPEADAAVEDLAKLNPGLVDAFAAIGAANRLADAAEKRQAELEDQILTVLLNKGYAIEDSASRGGYDWTPYGGNGDNPVLLVEGDVKDYCENIAADLITLFGPDVRITDAATVHNYTVINNATESSVKADFEIMKAMNGE